MRATLPDPRLLLAALVAAFLIALAAAPTQLPDLHLSSSGGAQPSATAAQPAGTPAWVKDPMASPLDELRRP
jgi:hypothetical protein